MRSNDSSSTKLSSTNLKRLKQYRKEIEKIDAAIFRLCLARVIAAEKIFKFKVKNRLPLRDRKRESVIKNRFYKALKQRTTKARAFKFICFLIELNAKYPM